MITEGFPAGQLLWISWSQLKSKAGAQRGYGEPWPAAATVTAPALLIAARICEQGLPGAIPSWHRHAACALSPPVTSQKVLQDIQLGFKSHFVWNKENQLNWVTLCGWRIVLSCSLYAPTLHPTNPVKLSVTNVTFTWNLTISELISRALWNADYWGMH